jgi:xylulokinase
MYSLGLDIGSSSIKAAIIDVDSCKVVASVKYPENEMKIDSPQKNWAEQSPEDWWSYTLQAIQLALSTSGIEPSEIKSIGISYQMHGLVAVDQDGNTVRPSIIWCDSRAIESGEALASKMNTEVFTNHLFNKPGNFTASKLYWVKQNEPTVFEKIDKIMLPGDYIAFKMSGEITSTYSGMSEGMFFDFKNHELSKDILNAGGFENSIFPRCGDCFEHMCSTNGIFESATGIKNGTPITYRAGDQPNNAFSLGVLNDGEAAATGGTSGVVYAVSKDVKYDGLARVNSFAHVNHTTSNSSIGTLLCINGTGILYNWIRSNNFEGMSYSELEKIASSCSIGADGLCYMPFGNGAERMLNNRVLGASIHFIDLNRHSKSHLVRAGLEGIAFAFIYGMEAMKDLGIDVSKIRAGNDNLFQSSVFAHTLATVSGTTINIYETTGAIGAAKGAAYGAGLYTSLVDTTEHLTLINTIEPQANKYKYMDTYHRWKDQLLKLLY